MPTLVARQWHVWKATRLAPRALCHSHRLSGRTWVSPARLYAQTSSQNDKSCRLPTTNSAIIIPRSIAGLQPDDLISHIQPVHQARLTRDRFAVFLVTPAFAPWLLNDGIFLHKALRRAYQHMFDSDHLAYDRIHALCAVVDKLPTPQSISNASDVKDEVLERTRKPPVAEIGYEGIAYTTLRLSDSVTTASDVRDEKAAISFVHPGRSTANGYVSDTLQFPLANTVFQTGSPSTMAFSTWEKVKGAKDLTLKSKQDITHHSIKIHRNDTSEQPTSALAIPLIPLTIPRRVEASMGNILRKIIGADGKSQSASQELEQVVPQYFNARGESSQSAPVWALVMPKEALNAVVQKTNNLLGRIPDEVGTGIDTTNPKLWDDLWRRDPPFWNDLISTALASSAHLHRVLSGGGGWGKKAGLLSLDPVATTEDSNLSADGIFDAPGSLSSALQQVAHDGDYIQFFISPSSASPDLDDSKVHTKRLKMLTELSHPWGLELGTIPSTLDSLPTQSWQHGAKVAEDVFVFRHSFGALAEGGMILSRQFKLESQDAFSFIGRSKVDVPYSRYSVIDTSSDEGEIEGDSMQDTLHAKPTTSSFHRLSRLGLPSLKQPDRHPELHASESNVQPSSEDAVDTEAFVVPLVANPLRKTVSDTSVKKTIVKESAQAPIRYYKLTRDEVEHCANKLRQSQKVVQHFTNKLRNIIHHMDLSVKKFDNSSSGPKKNNVSSTTLAYIRKLSMEFGQHNTRLYTLQKEFQNIIVGNTHEVFEHLVTRIQQISTTIKQICSDFAYILNFINLRSRLTHATNNAAVELYAMQISLRWCLSAMIIDRQRYKHPHPLARSMVPLEKKLKKLRAYGSNLFYAKHPMSVQFIRTRLNEMESQNLLLPIPKHSDSAKHRQGINRTSVFAQIKESSSMVISRMLKPEQNSLKVNAEIQSTDSRLPASPKRVRSRPLIRRLAPRLETHPQGHSHRTQDLPESKIGTVIRFIPLGGMQIRFYPVREKFRDNSVELTQKRDLANRKNTKLFEIRKRLEKKDLVDTVREWLSTSEDEVSKSHDGGGVESLTSKGENVLSPGKIDRLEVEVKNKGNPFPDMMSGGEEHTSRK